VFLTPSHLGIAMEAGGPHNLLQYSEARGRLPERQAWWVFHQVVLALEHLHRQVRRGAGGRGGGLPPFLRAPRAGHLPPAARRPPSSTRALSLI
jgi:hypothetical protein